MAKAIPSFTFTGSYSTQSDDTYWYIFLKSTGEIKFSFSKIVDACIVGGGAGGRDGSMGGTGSAGGGGGSVKNTYHVSLNAGEASPVIIGSGGNTGENGSSSSAFGVTAEGGSAGQGGAGGYYKSAGGDGADGSGALGGGLHFYGGAGGGGGGGAGSHSGDRGDGGQGGRGGGGNGGAGFADGNAGTANTGGGGGGGGSGHEMTVSEPWHFSEGKGGAGASGIVVLRGTQDDYLPVFFDGTQLQHVVFNGVSVSDLIYGGTKIFARRCREWLVKRWACRFGFRRAARAE